MQLQRIATNWPEVPKDLKQADLRTMEDTRNAYLIKKYLGDLMWPDDKAQLREQKLACKYVRKFCVAMAKADRRRLGPVYLGASEVEDNQALIGYIYNNLETMWN